MEGSLRKSGHDYCWIDTGEGYDRVFQTLLFTENLVEGSSKPLAWRIALCSGQTGIEPQVLPVPRAARYFSPLTTR